ncbi:MAG: hypothetical protein GC152_06570 [Alphaproteobacteria bacterium]|nr:hypothetical protein [Alphaproteobacteria bacterium]
MGGKIGFRVLAVAVFAAYAWLASTAPQQAFTIDEYFYAEMARAMADDRQLTFRQMKLDGVESLDMAYAHAAPGGRLAPQYPSGYAVISAPFQAALGVRGLIVMNAFSGVAAIWLTFAIGRGVASPTVARLAAGLFAVASMAPTYYFSIWPHMTSLAVTLAGAYATLRAANGRGLMWGLGAGLALGAAATLRLDAVLAFVAALVWLRIFVGGRTRAAAVGMIVGFVPGLLFLVVSNAVKFGVANPLSYEAAGGSASLSRYAALATLICGALFVGFLIDAPRAAARGLVCLPACFRSDRAMAVAIVGLGLAALAVAPSRAFLLNVAVLTTDFSVAPLGEMARGLERDAFGVVHAFGVPKKAFLESAPYAPLAFFGLIAFLRGRGRRGEGLLWLIFGAYVCFYSLTRWHGGLSLNMRYLLPAAPAAAILSAIGLERLGVGPWSQSRGWLIATIVAISVFLLFQQSLSASPVAGLLVVAPPLLCGLALTCALVLRAAVPRAATMQLAAIAAFGAMGAGAGSGIGDAIKDRLIRQSFTDRAETFAAAAPEGALFLTVDPVIMFAAGAGVSVAHPELDEPTAVAAAVGAFLDAGRCVFADTDAADWARRHLKSFVVAEPIKAGPEWSSSPAVYHLFRAVAPAANALDDSCASSY